MASRYWVGGAGTWDGTSTTHWSATSGGAGGASVPTSADDVFFDANSGSGVLNCAGDVDIGTRSCRNLSFTTNNITRGNYFNVHVWGTVDWPDTVWPNLDPSIRFYGASTSTVHSWSNIGTRSAVTLTIRGGTFYPHANNLPFNYNIGPNYPGMTYNLCYVDMGGYNHSNNVSCQNGGTFLGGTGTFSGTVSISGGGATGGVFNLGSGSASKYITNLTMTGGSCNLGNCSNVTIGYTAKSGGTIDAGTSTVNTYYPESATWYNLITGASTISTVNATNATFTSLHIRLSGNINVSNTLDIGNNGYSAAGKGIVYGYPTGTLRTITASNLASTTVSAHINFSDIKFAGSIANTSGTNFGDGGGNDSIGFPASRNLYWVGGSGDYTISSHWATSSGGAGGNLYPRPQDNVYFDANSGGGAVRYEASNWGKNINMTGFTGTISSITNDVTSRFYGNLIIPSSTTIENNTKFFFYRGGSGGTPSQVTLPTGPTGPSLSCYSLDGMSLNSPMTLSFLNCQGGTTSTNNNNITLTTNGLACSNESGNTYGYLNCGTSTITFTQTSSQLAFINMGSNNINASNATFIVHPAGTVSGSLVWNFDTGSSFTIKKMIYRGNMDYAISYEFEGGINCTIAELVNEKTAPLTLNPPSSSTNLYITKWSCNGTIGNMVTITGGYMLYNGIGVVDGQYLNVSNSYVLPTSNTWYADPTTSINGGTNTGWIFTPIPKGGGLFFGSNF